MRLDKFLALTGHGTRKEVKQLIQQGLIRINGELAKKGQQHINESEDCITYLDEPIHYQAHYYVMLNKPDGIVSATEDRFDETVIDWVALDYQHVDLFPVGRLDKDTTGLLLLTNNGQLAHQLMSPKKQVPKKYQATIQGIVNQEDVEKFRAGIDLGDFVSQPADLEILETDDTHNQSQIWVTITEGKYHQVKRLFEAVGKEVLTLHRLEVGPLCLDPDLAVGEYRELTLEEQELLLPYGLIMN